jgi:hypothetical protein
MDRETYGVGLPDSDIGELEGRTERGSPFLGGASHEENLSPPTARKIQSSTPKCVVFNLLICVT